MKEDIEEKVASQLQKARSSVKKSKTLTPVQLFDRAVQAFKWWEHQHKDDKVYWTTLQHNGIIFQPPYAPHHVPLYYDGKPVELTAEQEEIATLYATSPTTSSNAMTCSRTSTNSPFAPVCRMVIMVDAGAVAAASAPSTAENPKSSLRMK